MFDPVSDALKVETLLHVENGFDVGDVSGAVRDGFEDDKVFRGRNANGEPVGKINASALTATTPAAAATTDRLPAPRPFTYGTAAGAPALRDVNTPLPAPPQAR